MSGDDASRTFAAMTLMLASALPPELLRAAAAAHLLAALSAERDPTTMATMAAAMALAGEDPDRTADLAERAAAGLDGTDPAWYDAVRALVLTDRCDAAERELDRDQPYDPGAALAIRAELALRTGDLERAETAARALLGLSRARGRRLQEELAAAWLGEVLIERGDLTGAERVLGAGGLTGAAVAFARGRLRLAQGRAGEAIAELRACDGAHPALLPWRSALAEAFRETARARGEIAPGRGDIAAVADDLSAAQARRLAAEELQLARTPRAIGIAMRAAAGDDVVRLREAVAILDGTEARLERARAHAALGAALRRAGDHVAARDPLRAAVDLAHRCGATALEEHALAELRATGAKPRRRLMSGAGSLTPSERRIAELAASGRLNREIADHLVVTLATVEYHLRNAYRKLGIASRRELTAAL
jgi:DNA-binding NarL/FixJ family response regulator